MNRVFVLFATMWLTAMPAVGFSDEQDAIAKIEKDGGSVRKVAANEDAKDVDFHLSGKSLTDEGLANVADLDHVIWLNLKDTAITDQGLTHLKGLKELKKLHLERTGITDLGLAHLASLPSLEYLNLYGTKVTDSGIEQLAKLKNLKRLYLWQSEVTEEGADKLKEALPDLIVNLGAELKPVVVEPVESPTPANNAGKTLGEGQFLRVRLAAPDKILSLAEVEVLEVGSGKTLQGEAKAAQSSVAYGGEAKRAVDGSTKHSFPENTVTHTEAEDYPWWLLDLGKPTNIGTVKIWNRSDCCGERLEGAIVEILDADKNVVWSDTIEEATDGSVHEFAKE